MYKIYMVKLGDTVESIANEHNVKVDELKRINGEIVSLYPGMQLIVPNNMEYMTYIVMPGDTLYSIANKYSVSLDNLVTLNGLNKSDYIYPGQQILIPNNDMEIYTITQNDTLKGVLRKLDITLDELLSNNNEIYLEENQPIKYKGRK